MNLFVSGKFAPYRRKTQTGTTKFFTGSLLKTQRADQRQDSAFPKEFLDLRFRPQHSRLAGLWRWSFGPTFQTSPHSGRAVICNRRRVPRRCRQFGATGNPAD